MPNGSDMWLPTLKVGPRASVAACSRTPGCIVLHEGAAHIFVGSVV
jgi:hypothetical protein